MNNDENNSEKCSKILIFNKKPNNYENVESKFYQQTNYISNKIGKQSNTDINNNRFNSSKVKYSTNTKKYATNFNFGNNISPDYKYKNSHEDLYAEMDSHKEPPLPYSQKDELRITDTKLIGKNHNISNHKQSSYLASSAADKYINGLIQSKINF